MNQSLLEKARQTYQTLKKNKYSQLKNENFKVETAGPYSKSLNPKTSKIRQMMNVMNDKLSEELKQDHQEFKDIIGDQIQQEGQ